MLVRVFRKNHSYTMHRNSICCPLFREHLKNSKYLSYVSFLEIYPMTIPGQEQKRAQKRKKKEKKDYLCGIVLNIKGKKKATQIFMNNRLYKYISYTCITLLAASGTF